MPRIRSSIITHYRIRKPELSRSVLRRTGFAHPGHPGTCSRGIGSDGSTLDSEWRRSWILSVWLCTLGMSLRILWQADLNPKPHHRAAQMTGKPHQLPHPPPPSHHQTPSITASTLHPGHPLCNNRQKRRSASESPPGMQNIPRTYSPHTQTPTHPRSDAA